MEYLQKHIVAIICTINVLTWAYVFYLNATMLGSVGAAYLPFVLIGSALINLPCIIFGWRSKKTKREKIFYFIGIASVPLLDVIIFIACSALFYGLS